MTETRNSNSSGVDCDNSPGLMLNKNLRHSLAMQILTSTHVINHEMLHMMFADKVMRGAALSRFSKLDVFFLSGKMGRLYSKQNKDIFYCLDFCDVLSYDYIDIISKGIAVFCDSTSLKNNFLNEIYLDSLNGVDFKRIAESFLSLQGVTCISLPYDLQIRSNQVNNAIVKFVRKFSSSLRILKHLTYDLICLLPKQLKDDLVVINVGELKCPKRDKKTLRLYSRNVPNKAKMRADVAIARLSDLNYYKHDQDFYAFYAQGLSSTDDGLPDEISLRIQIINSKQAFRSIKQPLASYKYRIKYLSMQILSFPERLEEFLNTFQKIKTPLLLPCLRRLDLSFVRVDGNPGYYRDLDGYNNNDDSYLRPDMSTFASVANISKEWLQKHIKTLSYGLSMSITVTLDVDYTRSELSDPEHKLLSEVMDKIRPEVQMLQLETNENRPGFIRMSLKRKLSDRCSHETIVMLRTLTYVDSEDPAAVVKKKPASLKDVDTVFKEPTTNL